MTNLYQERAKECKCCGKHVPLPTVLREFNGIMVCPTTYANILEYTRIWKQVGSRPAGNIRKHFSEYVQQVVETSIDNISSETL
jgi:hypothetical protein